MKKSISPLISWILIVAFVIAIGAFVTTWMIDYVKSINLDKGVQNDLYCDVQLSVIDACRSYDNRTFIANLTNNGKFSVIALTFNRETSESPISSCLILNTNMAPGSQFDYQLALANNFTDSISECPQSSFLNFPANESVLEVSVIPWVKIKDNTISCPQKKITINENNLNTYC